MRLLLLAAATLIGLGGCSGRNNPDPRESEFALNAASSGVLAGWLAAGALTHAAREDVREFAYAVIEDHRRGFRGLEQAAEKAHLRLPQEMTPEDEQAYIRLTSLRGDTFDRAYLEATIEEQERAVAAFRAAAAQSDSDVGRWAAETLPTLEKQLARARELAARTSTVTASMPGG